MTPERWQQVDRLLQAALEREPSERAAFLRQASQGDDSLRREVESLLASDEGDRFLKSAVLEHAALLLDDGKSNSLFGRRIGSFQILSQLGAGGMGEVYLAQDTRLGRKVALKLLPSYFTKDQQRLRRFQQEARAASGLNHPNIITIFDIGEVDSIHFIATEYIEVETLRTAMRKAMTLGQVLDIAIQTASALQAAHQAGIAHRDIKPENIMLRADGYVKVLDFGLAKLAEKPGLTSDTGAATIARVETDPGTVMGTASYMSPEQARGHDLDGRTDIFSLGVVIYEMVAGRVPFEGETTSDVIATILEKQPPPLVRYSPDAPAEVQWIVTKALRKDKDERYQTVREMLGDLKDLKAELDSQTRRDRSTSSEVESGTQSAAHRGEAVIETASVGNARPTKEVLQNTSSAEIIISEIKRHKLGATFILVALAAVVVGLALGLYKFIGHNDASQPLPTPKMTRLTTGGRAGNGVINGGAAISPDGKYVVFETDEGGKWSLWLRQVSTNSLQRILGPIAGNYLVSSFSPDGEFIYYTANDKDNLQGALYQVPVLGGTPRKLVSRIDGSISFSPDGKQFAFVRFGPLPNDSSLIIANADGSAEHTLATHGGSSGFSGPSWSPDGKMIACGVMASDRSPNIVTGTVIGVSVVDGTEKPLTSRKWPNVFRVLWLKDGSGLIVGAAEQQIAEWALTQLWLLSYPSGEVRRITNDLNRYSTLSLGLTADSSTIVTMQRDTYRQIWLTAPNEDASHAKQISHGKVDGFDGLAWTPDGRIVYITQAGQNVDLWIMNSDGTDNRQLTADAYQESLPEATSDGRYVVFLSDQGGAHQIWRMNLDGSSAKPITEDDATAWAFDCSPDGHWIAFHRAQAGKTAILKVSIDGGTPVQLTDIELAAPVFSPDGKFLALAIDRQAQPLKIAIIPAEGGEPVKTFDVPQTLVKAALIKWFPDGRALTYVITLDGVDNIWTQPIDGSPPKQLTNFKSDHILQFAWSRNGKLAVSRGNNTSEVVLIRDFK
jgi:eukaryotic-like serine/threonine-protein kinase